MDIAVLLLCMLLLPEVVLSDCFFDSQQYEGHVSTTINNHQCRPWSDVLTPGNPVTSNLPDNSLADANNFCRDPDSKGHPWCYVSMTSLQQGWEFCNVPYCQECYYTAYNGHVSTPTPAANSTAYNGHVSTPTPAANSTAYNGHVSTPTPAANSTAYNGHVSTPTPATTCQHWVNLPNSIQLLHDTQFPEGSIAKARNFCRDPLNLGTLYCYVNDVRTGCNIPECAGACADDQSTNCAVIEASIGLCKDVYFSTTLCAKTCNKCGVGLLPAVHKSPPNDVCFDKLDANCAVLSSLVCSNPHAARTLCPKTCNMCGTPTGSHVTAQHTTTTPNPDYFTTAAPTLSTTSTTGSGNCRDMDGVNCAALAVQHKFCTDDYYSRRFCRKTCGKCDLPALHVSRNECNNKFAKALCTGLNRLTCICDDPDRRLVFCPHYCAGECGAVGYFPCSHITPVGRRKRLADLMKQQVY